MTTVAVAPKLRCQDHSRYVAGCTSCRSANAARKRIRTRLIAYGQWDGLIDAEPAREHINKLGELGMSRAAVARAAGVGSTVVDQIYRGQPTTGANTARRILAVEPVLPDNAVVSSLGTSRRLQSLMTAGWDAVTLVAMLDASPNQVSRWRWRAWPTMRNGDHKRVAALYRQIGDRPGPSDAARAQAGYRGYVPSICWDDDGDIDDPNAKPKGLRRTSV